MKKVIKKKLDKKESEILKNATHGSDLKEIAATKKISYRMVQLIREGKFYDNHDVIPLLIKAAKRNKAAKEKISKTIKSI